MSGPGFSARIFLVALVLVITACAGQGRRSPGGGDAVADQETSPSCPPGVNKDIGYVQHVLVADRKGDYDQSFLGTEMREVDQAVAGDEDPYRNSKTFEEQFLNILKAYRTFHNDHDSSRILLFVNGGLNARRQSITRAKEQTCAMMEDGYFPIFMIWRSSGPESYWEQVSKVRDGLLLSDVSPTTPLYILSDLLQGLARAPVSWSSQFWRWVGSFDESLDKLEDSRARNRLNVQFPETGQSAADFRADTVTAVLTSPLKMATTPLIDGIGKTAWENMVRRTRMTFRNAAEFEENERLRARDVLRYPRGSGVFAKFLAELEWCMRGAKLRKSRSGIQGICERLELEKLPADTTLTVIGHSMGTIVINDMLRAFPELPYENIVFMAGAASIRDSLISLSPLLMRDNAQPQGGASPVNASPRADSLRFFNLSLHPLAEIQESNAFNTVPDGSLLAWVDDMYQSSPSALDRTIGQWRNVARAASVFPREVREHMYFRVFGFRPGNCRQNNRRIGDPVMHGDFNLTCMHYWRENFWWSKQREPSASPGRP